MGGSARRRDLPLLTSDPRTRLKVLFRHKFIPSISPHLRGALSSSPDEWRMSLYTYVWRYREKHVKMRTAADQCRVGEGKIARRRIEDKEKPDGSQKVLRATSKGKADLT